MSNATKTAAVTDTNTLDLLARQVRIEEALWRTCLEMGTDKQTREQHREVMLARTMLAEYQAAHDLPVTIGTDEDEYPLEQFIDEDRDDAYPLVPATKLWGDFPMVSIDNGLT